MEEVKTQSAKAELDPVCGMKVDPANARGPVNHEGKEYFFCSLGCAIKFKADPAQYLPGPSPLEIDPVCGMKVDPAKARGKEAPRARVLAIGDSIRTDMKGAVQDLELVQI